MRRNQHSSKSSAASVRYWDPLAAFVLLAALTAAAARVVVTRWTADLNLVLNLALLGMVAGLALGQSRFPAVQAALFAAVYGLFTVSWQLGGTLDPELMWPDRLGVLADRLSSAVVLIARQQPVYDALFFLSLMTSLFWGISVNAGYRLARHGQAWRAALPAGFTLLVVQAYDPAVASRAWFMAAYLFLTLLLVARLAYLRDRAHWRQNRVHLPQYLELDLARFILLITTLLVLLAWGIPSLAAALPPAAQAWQRATDPWWSSVRERAGDAFASLRGTREVIGYMGYYGQTLHLGYGSDFPDTPFMTVTPPSTVRSPRYYWRARVYDEYADGRWTSTLTATQAITPTEFDLPLPDLDVEGRSRGFFTFSPAVPMLTLYTAPQPVWVNHRAEAALAYNSDGTVDLGTLTATPPLAPEQEYRAQSSLSTVTVTRLRAAGTDYPEWVTARYLQLPASITARTLQLAGEIALERDNPYDVAAAVTEYLRAQIDYVETIPSPPRDQEPLDWFLFDQREGFCNYYASAEVVLLRSLGIPARLAAGFAEGELQDDGTYLVLHSNVHAWPEVYFPGLGWVEFEPTVSESPLLRPLGLDQAGAAAPVGPVSPSGEDRLPFEELMALMEEELSPEPSSTGASRSRGAAIWWVAVVLPALAAIVFVWRKRRRGDLPPLPVLLVSGLQRLGFEPPAVLHRWARRSVLPPLERAYQEVNQALVRLGAPPDPGDTPAERASALGRILPAASGSAQRLLREYHLETFSREAGNVHVAQGAAHVIRTFSRRTRIRRLFARHEQTRR